MSIPIRPSSGRPTIGLSRATLATSKVVRHFRIQLFLRLLRSRVAASGPAALFGLGIILVTPTTALTASTWASTSAATGRRASRSAPLSRDVSVDAFPGGVLLGVPALGRV